MHNIALLFFLVLVSSCNHDTTGEFSRDKLILRLKLAQRALQASLLHQASFSHQTTLTDLTTVASRAPHETTLAYLTAIASRAPLASQAPVTADVAPVAGINWLRLDFPAGNVDVAEVFIDLALVFEQLALRLEPS